MNKIVVALGRLRKKFRKRTYEIKTFFDDPRQILHEFEKKAKLPNDDLELRDEWKGVTLDFLNVFNYTIYSKTKGKNVGWLKKSPNPIGSNGSWSNRRAELQKRNPNDFMLSATFAGGGLITIEK